MFSNISIFWGFLYEQNSAHSTLVIFRQAHSPHTLYEIVFHTLPAHCVHTRTLCGCAAHNRTNTLIYRNNFRPLIALFLRLIKSVSILPWDHKLLFLFPLLWKMEKVIKLLIIVLIKNFWKYFLSLMWIVGVRNKRSHIKITSVKFT